MNDPFKMGFEAGLTRQGIGGNPWHNHHYMLSFQQWESGWWSAYRERICK